MKIPFVVATRTVPPLPEFKQMPAVANEPQARARMSALSIPPGEGVTTGIWECQPGVFRRQVSKREFSHFLAGRCVFKPDNGEPITIAAGDAAYFPANCDGTWIVSEAITKSFVIID